MLGAKGDWLDRKQHAFAGAANVRYRYLPCSRDAPSTSEKDLKSMWNYIRTVMGRAVDPENNVKAVRFQPRERMTAEQIVWGACVLHQHP